VDVRFVGDSRPGIFSLDCSDFARKIGRRVSERRCGVLYPNAYLRVGSLWRITVGIAVVRYQFDNCWSNLREPDNYIKVAGHTLAGTWRSLIAMGWITKLIIKRRQQVVEQRLPAGVVERLGAMVASVEAGDLRARPSKYWVELNRMNLAQLQQHGYENFKRTIALNYFTFVRILPWDAQIIFLLRKLPLPVSLGCIKNAFLARKHDYFSSFNWIQSLLYNFLTLASWAYSRSAVTNAALLALREPEEGNPAIITDQSGAMISQDLANSVLEVSAMGAFLAPGSIVLELGAGYGRDAYAMLSTNPGIKYVVIDIAPALWVAETYLSHQFPESRIFPYREFSDFSEVEAEFRECDIAFFLSTQITLLPARFADLVINISSLHEMRPEQISFYFMEFDRLLKPDGLFYFKQWKRGVVPFENVVIHEEDYPIPASWHCEFTQQAPIQTRFFEARYRKTT
jgi:putative sugar O-methyltransferase